MATGKLYTYPDNVRAYKILIAGQYSGAKITVVQDPPQFKFGETNKSQEFLKKFPLGKDFVHLLRNTKLKCLPAGSFSKDFKKELARFEKFQLLREVTVCAFSESNAIAYYVANSQLRGADALAQSKVQMFINFADNEILPAACNWVFPTLGVMQYNKSNTERAKEDIKKALGYLNEILKTKTFLVGERATLADICVACNLLILYKNVLEPQFRAPYTNVNRWFTTMVNQPEAKAILGEVQLCTKAAQFDAKTFAVLSGKADKKKDEKKEVKKETKKAVTPKKKEEEVPAAPKEKADPFADLPAHTMDMDAFKRCYSNNDTVAVSVPYFWEHFDKEQYSIWMCDYKYHDELKMSFMTCNLIGGMFQRLDRLRKHAFGVNIIFGEDNNSTISGIWFWRGKNLIFDRSEDWQVDSPSYTWTNLDPDTPETKKLVEEYFACEGNFGGKTVLDYKIFK